MKTNSLKPFRQAAAKTAVDALKIARRRLRNPKRWHKGSYSRFNKNGKPVASCAFGHLQYDHIRTDVGIYWEAHGCLVRAVSIIADARNADFAVTEYNDAPERTHEEILALFDKAIEIAKSEV